MQKNSPNFFDLWVFTVLISLIFTSCEDKLYQEPVLKLAVPNEYRFTGVASIGSPISNATISAFEFSGLQKGNKLCDASSNERGEYELSCSTTYEGPILLEAEGGNFFDLITGEDTVLDKSYPLKSAISHTDVISRTNINAWTTIAVARAQAKKGFWNTATKELSDKRRIEQDFAAISHLLSKNGMYVNISRTPMLASYDDIKEDSSELRLHQAHGGLAWIVHSINKNAVREKAPLKIYELIHALAKDMGNRTFNGIGDNHERIRYSEDSDKYLNTNTMRKDLAMGISLFTMKKMKGLKDGYKENFLNSKDSLFRTVAYAKSPDLFAELDYPERLESQRPEIEINFISEPKGEGRLDHSIFYGDIPLKIIANDELGIVSLEVIEPDFGFIADDDELVISENQLPQWEKAFDACSEVADPSARIVIEEYEVKPICVCVKAINAFGNENKALKCFERAKPTINFSSPSADHIINLRELTLGTKIIATGTSGYDLTECVWELDWIIEEEKVEGFILPSGKGEIDGRVCMVEFDLTPENVPNALLELKMRIVDEIGQVKDPGYGRWGGHLFSVRAEEAVIKVLSPKNEARISSDEIEIQIAQESSGALVSVWVEVWPIHDQSQIIKVRAKKRGDIWVAKINGLEDGKNYHYATYASAYNGSKAAAPLRLFRTDRSPPKIKGSKHKVPQPLYMNETSKYTIDGKGASPKIIPVGTKQNLWDGASPAHIKRWVSNLNDISTAPGYQFQVLDNESIEKAYFSIDRECSTKQKAVKEVEIKYGFGNISITEENSDVELSNLFDEELCLSIWVTDSAGNSTNLKEKFFWSSIAPPLLAMPNDPELPVDWLKQDFSNINYTIKDLVDLSEKEGVLKKGLVVGHVRLENPYEIEARLSPSLESKITLNVSMARRIRDEKGRITMIPAFMAPKKGRAIKIFMGLPNPFIGRATGRYPHYEPIGNNLSLIYTLEYDRLCELDEIAVFRGVPEWSIQNNDGEPSGIVESGLQKISCIKDTGLPKGYTHRPHFGKEPGNYPIARKVFKYDIGSDNLNVTVLKAHSGSILGEEVKQTVSGAYLLEPGEAVYILYTLKDDFNFKPMYEFGDQSICDEMSFQERENSKDRIFGACNFAMVHHEWSRTDRGCANPNVKCRGNFLFDTVEDISLSFDGLEEGGSDPDVGILSNFAYSVSVGDNNDGTNEVRAYWNANQLKRRRVLSN